MNARLVTAQVLRLLDSAQRALAKKELFAVKGMKRSAAPDPSHEEHPSTPVPEENENSILSENTS